MGPKIVNVNRMALVTDAELPPEEVTLELLVREEKASRVDEDLLESPAVVPDVPGMLVAKDGEENGGNEGAANLQKS